MKIVFTQPRDWPPPITARDREKAARYYAEEEAEIRAVELVERIIPASDLTDESRRRIEAVLRENFHGQPKADPPLADRLGNARRAIGEAPSREAQAVAERARAVAQSMRGGFSDEERQRAADARQSLYGRPPDPDVDRRTEEMKRALYGERHRS